ncbi:MAG TPA: carbon storage regulator [Ignavibacteriaceae bacterium]|nr:carbon storage regulator [Ignavibacteriaceae bacterium]
MLILARKNGDEIIIDSKIIVKVISASDGSVKIGITAPEEIEILRGEIYSKVKESTLRASEESRLRPLDISKLKFNKFKE